MPCPWPRPGMRPDPRRPPFAVPARARRVATVSPASTADGVVAIVGLGYVGLPLAQASTESMARVVGFDVNAAVVAQLGSGVSHVDDISDAEVQAMLDGGFEPTL